MEENRKDGGAAAKTEPKTDMEEKMQAGSYSSVVYNNRTEKSMGAYPHRRVTRPQ